MIYDALGIVSSCITAAVTWFGQLLAALPGAGQLLLSMFFLVTSFSVVLRPLYKGGAASLARRQEADTRREEAAIRTESYRAARLAQSRRYGR